MRMKEARKINRMVEGATRHRVVIEIVTLPHRKQVGALLKIKGRPDSLIFSIYDYRELMRSVKAWKKDRLNRFPGDQVQIINTQRIYTEVK